MGERGRIVATLFVAVACGGGALATLSGCPLKNCDPHNEWYTNGTHETVPYSTDHHQPPHAGAIDPLTWQSGGVDDPWLPYNGQTLLGFEPMMSSAPDAGAFAGPYTEIITYISPDERPNQVSNFTIATGNLAEVSGVDPFYAANTVNVKNDTCAPYFARVVVRRSPLTADAGPVPITGPAAPLPDAAPPPEVDSSADAPADGPSDAGIDSPLDAPTDVRDGGAE